MNQCSAIVKAHYQTAGSLYPTLFPGEGAEASEGGSSGHVGETSPLQLGHRRLKHHTHPVSCTHRPNHSPSAEKQGSHVKLKFISCTALCHMAEMVSVRVSWHNSFTFCDSFLRVCLYKGGVHCQEFAQNQTTEMANVGLPASTSSPLKQN